MAIKEKTSSDKLHRITMKLSFLSAAADDKYYAESERHHEDKAVEEEVVTLGLHYILEDITNDLCEINSAVVNMEKALKQYEEAAGGKEVLL